MIGNQEELRISQEKIRVLQEELNTLRSQNAELEGRAGSRVDGEAALQELQNQAGQHLDGYYNKNSLSFPRRYLR